MSKQILILAGDGIGPEIVGAAEKVLNKVNEKFNLSLTWEHGLLGGAAIDAHGEPYPAVTSEQAKKADAILLGAVGGPKWDTIERSIRPERGLLKIRSELNLFANLRPAILYPQLADASSLKPEIVAGLDILIVRELTGGIYFGQPRGIRELENGEKQGYNTDVYSESEIKRIAKVAFELAGLRGGKVCSVDKANVLEVTELWKQTVTDLQQANYPNIQLSHMYVDNAAMQLVRAPKQFDVIVTGNLFGDILSDEAAMLTGSIGMLPSASLDENGKGMYEPCHGSAPDIAGQNVANPLATILSVAMMLRYTFREEAAAKAIEDAVGQVLDQGLRTADIMSEGMTKVGTAEMGEAVVAALADLRKEVGNDAARFYYVMRKSEQHIDFDLDLAVSQSKDNAVYYIQYAHARICRMLEKAASTGLQFEVSAARSHAARLSLDAETEILAKLAAYPDVVLRAANAYEPHQVGNYLKELAALFHGWYNEHKVLSDDAELTQARLLLSINVQQVLRNGLELLGVSAPEAM